MTLNISNKRLVIIRHAKSDSPDFIRRDVERCLSARGYGDAEIAAQWLRKHAGYPDLMLSSPAIRAYTTAMIFSAVFDYPVEQLRLHASVYAASAHQLFYVMKELPDAAETVFLFGHNPGMTDFVNLLCGPVCEGLQTSGVAVISLPPASWSAINEGDGRLEALYQR